jgi:HAD superfamily phosphoserine phosphatase-like hydrolase
MAKTKKNNEEERETPLFCAVLATIMECFSLRSVDLGKTVREISNNQAFSESTVRSWKSRNPPARRTDFTNLCKVIDHSIDNLVLSVYFGPYVEKMEQTLLRYVDRKTIEKPEYDFLNCDDLKGTLKRVLEFAFANRQALPKKTEIPVLDMEAGKEVVTSEKQPKRIVAFDLDGTLIKGIRHSWTILWKIIGRSADEAHHLKKDFETGKISYQEWTEDDCKHLREGGLTKAMVHKAVVESRCTLTKNLRKAVKKLQDNNCICAIISGGADCVLYDLMPDADELFGKENIFINQCKFDERGDGIIYEIVPTPYDWDEGCLGVEGKAAGLKLLCAKHGVRLEDSVFVGDDRNDFRAMEIAGMKIFYHSSDPKDHRRGTSKGPAKRPLPDMIIEEANDLMFVADIIINWDSGD